MAAKNKPVRPVKPVSMELIFFYPCPFCGRQVPTIAQTQPVVINCDACSGQFPIVPIDDESIKFVKIAFGGGPAGIDPDFV